MSHRLMTWQKATALVPLALLSGAWTASLTATSTASAATDDEGKLPDGTSLPAEAVEAPASLSVPGVIAPGVPAGSADSVVASASTNGIPAAALAAYQRAAQVIDSADPGCKVDWTLIAAIGRVESDHGRYGGNKLTDEGLSTPGIFGIPLDGSNGTARIGDTDAAELDNDPVFDRAVGPMQFIPSTWRVVGVDGDGDGVRNPQDIDDAALATAVYLCSGDEDLSTVAGQRSAVYRYNHSEQYVDLVLSIMQAYGTGEYAAVPNGSAAPATFTAYFGDSVVSPGTRGAKSTGPAASGGGNGGTSGGGTSPSGGGTSGETATEPGTPAAGGGTDDPADKVEGAVKNTGETVTKVLISTSQAVSLCTAELQAQYGAAPQEAVDQCAAALQGKTVDEAKAAVDNVVAGLEDLVTGLLGGVGGLLG